MTDERKKKTADKVQRKLEVKKQEDQVTNMVVAATVEIICLLMGLTLIYRAYMGYLSVSAIFVVRALMIVLGVGCIALIVFFVIGMKKGKRWGFHALTALFGAILFFGIRFGHHIAGVLTMIMGNDWRERLYAVFSTKHLIYGAALVGVVYFIGAFIWLAFQSRKVKNREGQA